MVYFQLNTFKYQNNEEFYMLYFIYITIIVGRDTLINTCCNYQYKYNNNTFQFSSMI